MTTTRGGRRFEPVLDVLVSEAEGRFALRAPAVGLWRSPPAPGALVRGGDAIGELEVLGQRFRLQVPTGASGIVVVPEHAALDPHAGRLPVHYGQELVILDPAAAGEAATPTRSAAEQAATESGALAFRSPSSGRFYGRPGPDKAPFVIAGSEIAEGATVCLLEVMKTFNRVTYGGAGLPARARVVRVVPRDEADLNAGDVILELEPL
jgi:acetyl-CoA carboxylase biotin carboxyl carrier protein